MNSRTKGITAVIALLPVAIAGLYLSDFLVLTLLGEHAQVQLLTYWCYWQVVDQPAWHPYAPKIKLSGICGFGLPAMLDLIKPRPSVQQTMHDVQQFDHVEAIDHAVYLTQQQQLQAQQA
ncbi:hypothetical protein [Xanthomonas sp. GPE 39]|uniref:hypothetical protein n=1 Tax=Xanthomonas sp. GPE 39 TaxID=1583099 RepID=UPI0005F2B6BB|nr:hypothetical protein [Xanthomonas sp. GPE 39]